VFEMSFFTINNPELLQIKGVDGSIYYGGDQEWFQKHIQRRAGCGPTCCANIMWYLSQTRNEGGLASYDGTRKDGFVQLMNEMWNYVTPGNKGVNSVEMFLDGALRYGNKKGISLDRKGLSIPAKPFLKPSRLQIINFLCGILEKNIPLAFLNLSNGKVDNLESWHWVTLVALHTDTLTAVIYDQGISKEINLSLWLETTALGGGFAALDIAVRV